MTVQDQVIQRVTELGITDLDEAFILSVPTTEQMFGVNRVGRRIFQLLESPTTLDHVVTTLVEEFQVDRSQCESDVAEFVNELADQGMLSHQ